MASASEKSFVESVWETVKTIFWALIIAGVFRTFLFQPFWIPSGSMKDTLLIGDFLFVNKMAYGYSYASCPKVVIPAVGINLQPEHFCGFLKGREDRILGGDPDRGDVVVFRNTITQDDFIKRLIGLPGDRVQMKSGVLHINDAPVVLERDGDFIETMEPQGPQRRMPLCQNGAVGTGGDCVKEKYKETLPGGVTHSVLNVAEFGGRDNTKVYTVPDGHFFFMGDNRDNSGDSRIARPAGVGMVPADDLVGRADRIMFSSAGRSMLAFWTWRGDRFFKRIE